MRQSAVLNLADDTCMVRDHDHLEKLSAPACHLYCCTRLRPKSRRGNRP